MRVDSTAFMAFTADMMTYTVTQSVLYYCQPVVLSEERIVCPSFWHTTLQLLDIRVGAASGAGQFFDAEKHGAWQCMVHQRLITGSHSQNVITPQSNPRHIQART